MTELFQSPNPAVAAVNDLLTAAGHDMTTRQANADWYGNPHRQRAEQLAFALLPAKHHREAPRLFAEHLLWLSLVKSRDYHQKLTFKGWHWRWDNHRRLALVLCLSSEDTVKKATADLRKAGLIDSREGLEPGTFNKVVNYRLTDEAHIILGLISLAGAGSPRGADVGLNDRQFLELLAPTDPAAKPLRDVLDGWQTIDTPEAVNAMRAALVEAVARVSGDTSGLPRKVYESFRSAMKLHYPDDDPGCYSDKNRKRVADIMKELKKTAGEPSAPFAFTPEAMAAFFKRSVEQWDDLAAKVKVGKGKKLPPVPDLDALAWHLPHAVKVAFSPADPVSSNAAKAGW